MARGDPQKKGFSLGLFTLRLVISIGLASFIIFILMVSWNRERPITGRLIQEALPPAGEWSEAPDPEARPREDASDLAVATLIGTSEAASARSLSELLAHDPLNFEGQVIKLRARVQVILAPEALLLESGEGEEDGFLVIYRPEDVIGDEPEEGQELVVQGQVIRLSLGELEDYLGDSLEPVVYVHYQGEPALLVSPLAH